LALFWAHHQWSKAKASPPLLFWMFTGKFWRAPICSNIMNMQKCSKFTHNRYLAMLLPILPLSVKFNYIFSWIVLLFLINRSDKLQLSIIPLHQQTIVWIFGIFPLRAWIIRNLGHNTPRNSADRLLSLSLSGRSILILLWVLARFFSIFAKLLRRQRELMSVKTCWMWHHSMCKNSAKLTPHIPSFLKNTTSWIYRKVKGST